MYIARNLFKDSNYDTVIAIHIPHNHAMMHLDTVFTMINYNQFTVHPQILDEHGKVDTYILHPARTARSKLSTGPTYNTFWKKRLMNQKST